MDLWLEFRQQNPTKFAAWFRSRFAHRLSEVQRPVVVRFYFSVQAEMQFTSDPDSLPARFHSGHSKFIPYGKGPESSCPILYCSYPTRDSCLPYTIVIVNRVAFKNLE